MKFWKYEKKNSESSNFDLNLGDDSNENKMSQEDTDSEQSSNGESASNDYQKAEPEDNNSEASQEYEESGTSGENELNDEATSSASQNNRNSQITEEKDSAEKSQTEMLQTSENREDSDRNEPANEAGLEESSEPPTSTSQSNETESNPGESEETETSDLENSSNETAETKHSSTEQSEDEPLEEAPKTTTTSAQTAKDSEEIQSNDSTTSDLKSDPEKMQSNDSKTQEPESDFSEDKLPNDQSNQNNLEDDNSKKENQTSNNSASESNDDARSEETELAGEVKKSSPAENSKEQNQPLEEQPSKKETTSTSENNQSTSDDSVEEEKENSQPSNEETDSKNSSQNPAKNPSNSGTPSLQNAESLEESHDDSNHQESIEKLKQLKNIIEKYAKNKEKQSQSDADQEKAASSLETNDTPNEDEQEKETPQQNEFLNQLQQELPLFENRSRNDGYSISTNESIELPESLIRTIISKFLNQRFCKKSTDLNSRNHSLEKSKGFYKWEVKDIIVHSKTNQLNKVLDDKYGYEYSEGKSENIPLSFYFDMSCSMSRYSNMLAIIAIELLKKNVKVLIGYNARVNIQLDKVKSTMTLDELAEIIKTSGYYYSTSDREKVRNNSNVKCKVIEKRIDNFLVESHAEKCVVFSDFDPIAEVMRLSNFADVYWFCFEKDIKKRNLEKYQGFLYPVQTAQDIAIGLVKVSEKRFESLIYLDNPENLQRRKKL